MEIRTVVRTRFAGLRTKAECSRRALQCSHRTSGRTCRVDHRHSWRKSWRNEEIRKVLPGGATAQRSSRAGSGLPIRTRRYHALHNFPSTAAGGMESRAVDERRKILLFSREESANRSITVL